MATTLPRRSIFFAWRASWEPTYAIPPTAVISFSQERFFSVMISTFCARLRLSLPLMHGAFDRAGHDVGDLALDLHLHRCGIDVVFACKQCVDTLLRHFLGLALFLSFRPNLSVFQTRPIEKLCIRGPGLQRSHGDLGIAKFIAQAVREG